MADQQIEDLTALTSATFAADDELIINDVSDTTDDVGGSPKRVTASDLGCLAISAAKTGSFTAVQGVMYPVNLSAATANFTVTFPSAVDGATFGVFVATQSTTVGGSGFAQAPYWGVEPLTTTSIRKVSYTATGGNGVNKWGLMVDGESLVFRYDAVGATWNVIQDGRQRYVCTARMSANITTNTAATWKDLDMDTLYGSDPAGMLDTTGGFMDIKRANDYLLIARSGPVASISLANYFAAGVGSASVTADWHSIIKQGGAGDQLISTATVIQTKAAASTFYGMFISQETNIGARGTLIAAGSLCAATEMI